MTLTKLIAKAEEIWRLIQRLNDIRQYNFEFYCEYLLKHPNTLPDEVPGDKTTNILHAKISKECAALGAEITAMANVGSKVRRNTPRLRSLLGKARRAKKAAEKKAAEKLGENLVPMARPRKSLELHALSGSKPRWQEQPTTTPRIVRLRLICSIAALNSASEQSDQRCG